MNNKLILIAILGLFVISPALQAEEVMTPAMPKSMAEAAMKTDDKITADIKDAFAKDAKLAAFSKDVTVHTQNGVVTLSGHVSDESMIADFGAKASEVSGGKVINQLKHMK